MIREGDLVEIPLPDGRIAIGWILHISKYFKNAVGFCVFGTKEQLHDDIRESLRIDNFSAMPILGPLYTHKAAIKHYRWLVYSHIPVSNSALQLTKRLVGGNIYIGDNNVGIASQMDYSRIKPMLGLGMPVVYREIEKAFSN